MMHLSKGRTSAGWREDTALHARERARYLKITNRPDNINKFVLLCILTRGTGRPKLNARAGADTFTSYYFIGYLYAKGEAVHSPK